MANTPSKQATTTPETTSVTETQTATSVTGSTQVYFVPEYGVSVEATNLDDAIAQAKKLKGVK